MLCCQGLFEGAFLLLSMVDAHLADSNTDQRHKLVKCCGKEGKDREGSPASSVSQVASGDMSPGDSKR